MTLREAIIKGLGDKWTKELEDSLFWAVARFVDKVRENLTKDRNDNDR